tara:strand:+ start:98 stop:304 length:207 start_codon:yes stop_codon:yes gene_type:complete
MIYDEVVQAVNVEYTPVPEELPIHPYIGSQSQDDVPPPPPPPQGGPPPDPAGQDTKVMSSLIVFKHPF